MCRRHCIFRFRQFFLPPNSVQSYTIYAGLTKGNALNATPTRQKVCISLHKVCKMSIFISINFRQRLHTFWTKIAYIFAQNQYDLSQHPQPSVSQSIAKALVARLFSALLITNIDKNKGGSINRNRNLWNHLYILSRKRRNVLALTLRTVFQRESRGWKQSPCSPLVS